MNKSVSVSPNGPNTIMFADVKTLAVNDLIKDRALTIRLMSVIGKKEIAKTLIDVTKACYIQPNKMIMLKA